MSCETIFILSNNWMVTKETQKNLTAEKYKIEFVSDVSGFDVLLEKKVPDLLILEIFSVDQEILDFVKEVNNRPDIEKIPKIAILNRVKRDFVVSLVNMGYEEIYVKPIDREALLEAVDRALDPVESGNLRVKTEKTDDGFTIIELIDHLDATNSVKIDKFIDDLIRMGVAKLVFDFKKIDYIDSSGIGILLLCKKKIDLVNGNLRFINLNDEIKETFLNLHLDQIIEIELPGQESENKIVNEIEKKIENVDGKSVKVKIL